ncbi:hypothetical protein H3V13_10055 [Bartonella sp. M0280]|uniref:hypothetical protein n=1 Tax=Bartonella apihabitans TaxID=2750929 RepID=UPI0018DBAFAC|nr:hypothetical protein [Bartonella apihabitans]MBI0168307.1 hypothetical protein [Bartonella apihabitans]
MASTDFSGLLQEGFSKYRTPFQRIETVFLFTGFLEQLAIGLFTHFALRKITSAVFPPQSASNRWICIFYKKVMRKYSLTMRVESFLSKSS